MKPINYSIGLSAVALCLAIFPVQAQDKAEKGTIKIDLAYHQLNNDLPVISVSAKTKREKKFEPVEGAVVNLFFNTETADGFMGRVETDRRGAGWILLPARFKAQWDSLTSFKFIGTVTQNSRFENQSTDVEISKAKIELTLDEIDSVRTIHAKILAFHDNSWVAQPNTEIKLVVRRLMSDLKAAEEESFTTDDKGVVSTEFNLNLPGDMQGNIIIGAKIDDHELYGTVVSTKAAKWGRPLAPDRSFAKRTLWATRDKTPLWLLIFPNLIIICVWGIIFYLIYQITRIIKLGRADDPV